MKKWILIFLFCSAAPASIFINSFNSGRLSPDLKVRVDLERHTMGSETLTNILIRPQGMAYKRPGTEFISSAYGKYIAGIPAVPAVPAVPDSYKYTWISENLAVWGIPVTDMAVLKLDNGGAAVDRGGGVVGIPYANNPFVAGETVFIVGTSNYDDDPDYNGYVLQAGTDTTELRILDTYVPETFDGTETVVRKIPNLPSGPGYMAVTSNGTIYFAHDFIGTDPYYFVTRIDPDGTKHPDYEWLNYTWPIPPLAGTSFFAIGVAISSDDLYLYVWFYQQAITDWGYMYKFDLATGNKIWGYPEVTGIAWPGYGNISVDADGNVYAGAGPSYQIVKFDASDGTKTVMTGTKSLYCLWVDDAMGVVIAGGGTLFPAAPANLWLRTLDNTAGDDIVLGSITQPFDVTSVIAGASIVTLNNFIYAVIPNIGEDNLFKLSWNGASLSIVDSVDTGKENNGLYVDLWGNLVVICAAQNIDVLNYYDSNLNFLGTAPGMGQAPGYLFYWNMGASEFWHKGNIVFNGALDGTPGVPGVPEVPESWSYTTYGDKDNIRLIPFEYATNDAYVIEMGHEYLGFLRTIP